MALRLFVFLVVFFLLAVVTLLNNMQRDLKFHRSGVFQLLSSSVHHFISWQVEPPSPQ